MTQEKSELLDRIVAGMPGRFRGDIFPDLEAILQFDLTGESARKFHAAISNGACSLHEGSHNAPTLTLKMATETYLDMVAGSLTGQEAFFGRKLRYDGPISLAVKLSRMFEPL